MTIQSGNEESQEVGPIPEIEKPQRANGEDITLNDDIDPRIGEDRSELQAIEELEEVNIDPKDPSKVVKLEKNLCNKRKAELLRFLQENLDVFAWSHEDMIGISPSVIMHTLSLDKNMPAKSQKQRCLGTTRAEALKEEVA